MKNSHQNKPAFTLLELLTTLFIISIIISLSVIVYDVSWAKSRNSRRVSDIIRIQNALEKYHEQEGQYPDSITFGGDLVGPVSSTTYLLNIPQNPRPRADGSCADQEYQYSTTTDLYNNISFQISFCISSKMDQINAGNNCATENGIESGDCVGYNLKSGLKLWLEADAGITKDGSNLVSSWADQSGNNNNATSTGSAQPLFVANQANGKPVLRFDGIDDFMVFPEISDIRTVFLVIKHQSGSSSNYEPILGHSSLANFHGAIGTSLFFPDIVTELTGRDFVNGVPTLPIDMQKPTTYSIITLITTENRSAAYITNDRNAGRLWNGDYAEILIYNYPLSEASRLKIEEYLSDKYGI